jgi:hypothetical protein
MIIQYSTVQYSTVSLVLETAEQYIKPCIKEALDVNTLSQTTVADVGKSRGLD